MPSKKGTAAKPHQSTRAVTRTGGTRRKVRVAIVGVGNCASSLIQGVQYYKNARETDQVPGLMHVNLGGYHVRDIEFVAAFDIDREKVGKDLSQAIFSGQNNTVKFSDVPRLGVKVHRGMTHDGLGKYLKEVIHKAPGKTDDVVGILKKSRADVLVNYLPVGSEAATRWYMEQALMAGVAVVNCMPVFIAREDYWEQRFAAAGLPILGDDIKSQVGATIVHRILTRLFQDRGVQLENTYQLNFGGNTDFLNMLERERLESKKISKTNAVTSQLDKDINAKSVHVGPSDYVPWLNDRKWAFIRLEGKSFGDVPLNVELKLEVHDSPNSAGIVIDAVRFCKLALDNGIAGSLYGPSSWLMKSPPAQYTDDVAHRLAEEFILRPVAHPDAVGRDWHSNFADGHAREIAPAKAKPGAKAKAKAKPTAKAKATAKPATKAASKAKPATRARLKARPAARVKSPVVTVNGAASNRNGKGHAPTDGSAALEALKATPVAGTATPKPTARKKTPAAS